MTTPLLSTDVLERLERVLPAFDDLALGGRWAQALDVLDALAGPQRSAVVLTAMQIHGLHAASVASTVAASVHRSRRQGRVREQELCVRVEGKVLRLTARGPDACFRLHDGRILLDGIDTGISAQLVDMRGGDRNEGVYFPQQDGEMSYSAIRFNPRNRGSCVGGCVFCQRAFQLPTAYESERRGEWSAEELVARVVRRHGPGVISRIEHALVVTELFGSGDAYLGFCEELKQLLRSHGFRGRFAALAQEIRTPEQVRRLADIVERHDFCYTLECFDNRSSVMGRYKALPMEDVEEIIASAAGEGFAHVLVNYIAGLDSLASFEAGMTRLRSAGLSAVGLNLFVPYTDVQEGLRAPGSRRVDYYWRMLTHLRALGLRVYRPELYERAPCLLFDPALREWVG